MKITMLAGLAWLLAIVAVRDPHAASVPQVAYPAPQVAPSDRIRYLVNTAGREGPFSIDVELRYQPISSRWAQNLKGYDAMETNRFRSWYEAMSTGSSEVFARDTLSMR